MFKPSVELRNVLLEAMAAAVNGFVMKIYDNSGSVPTNAKDAVGSSVLLVTISLNGAGGGISFETDAVNGIISKKTTESWRGTMVATGVAAFYRMVSLTDNGTEQATAIRLQGSVAALNADLNIADVNLVSGEEQRVDAYAVGLPASAS